MQRQLGKKARHFLSVSEYEDNQSFDMSANSFITASSPSDSLGCSLDGNRSISPFIETQDHFKRYAKRLDVSIDRNSLPERSGSRDYKTRNISRKRKQRFTRSEERPYRHGTESLKRSVSSSSSKIWRRDSKFSDLPLEWWERSEDCKEAKLDHVDRIDYLCCSREFLVLQTTLWEKETELEPNMFPYDTPVGIKHYTLWSRRDLSHDEIIQFVDGWLNTYHPHVRRWQYDDNSGERSILLFHVHVFVEMIPFSFAPRSGLEYFPPHMQPQGK